MMDWSRGYSASYYITIVDPMTWMDIDRVEITEGSIQRSDSDLIESADITCVNDFLDGERIVRVWLDARQDSGYSHTPLFTGLATSPSRSIDGRRVTSRVQCYSILQAAQDVLLPKGWYAPTDANGGTLMRRLLSVCNAPITVDPDAKNLEYPIIAESGETNLSMAWKIANAINWNIRINGRGEIQIGPYDKTSKWSFGLGADDVLEPSIQVEHDWYSCPNVFRASSYGVTAVARDDDPNSPMSTVNRGREIWAEEEDCDLAADESLVQYAFDKLKEMQTASITASYVRRYYPDIYVFDTITLNYPEQNLVGNYMITSQNIELGYGAKTSEEVIAL